MQVAIKFGRKRCSKQIQCPFILVVIVIVIVIIVIVIIVII